MTAADYSQLADLRQYVDGQVRRLDQRISLETAPAEAAVRELREAIREIRPGVRDDLDRHREWVSAQLVGLEGRLTTLFEHVSRELAAVRAQGGNGLDHGERPRINRARGRKRSV